MHFFSSLRFSLLCASLCPGCFTLLFGDPHQDYNWLKEKLPGYFFRSYLVPDHFHSPLPRHPWFPIWRVREAHFGVDVFGLGYHDDIRCTVEWRKRYCIPALKLTARRWKLVVGRWISFWGGLFSGAMLVSGRIYIYICVYIRPPD